ncbi:ABC transporter ATP-binding protein [Tissierella sp. MB52-C2]|uniref:ABC transporter ATP-binding protein n=1 Tax=Tissierella sp. MB52-C2 TaxID=3070999 RepID=UPI00280AFF88|nr:ABC transporter ATP-binding protein [Tissierella sp. MB52-C2]WMM27010.1 ABC transporter ATP-binding protein [Tissierella sp. MB52-C2]
MIALLVIGNVILVTNSFMNLKMTDTIINQDLHGFYKYLAIVLGIMILKSLQGYIYGIYESKMVQSIGMELREDIVKELIEYDYEEYYSKDSGTYVSWLTQDVDYILNNGLKPFYTMFDQITAVIASLIGATMIHWSFIIIFPVSLLIMMITPKHLAPIMQNAAKDYSHANGTFVSKIKNIILGFGVFLSENCMEGMNVQVSEFTRKLEDIRYKYNKTIYFSNTIINTVAIFSQLLYIVATGILVVKGIITPGSVVGLMSLSSLFFGNAQRVVSQKMLIDSTIPVYEKIISMKNIEKSGKHTGNEEIKALSHKIEIKDLYYAYFDSKEILHGLNVTFDVGKKYAIVGKSGSGKTTLIKILSGNLKEYGGSVYYDDLELSSIDRRSLRNFIGVIDQDTYILNESIHYNITLGENFSDEEVQSALAKSVLLDFTLEQPNGKDYQLTENGKNLSGGQKQRIAIARAFIRNKKILFIDEGTSGLDSETRNAIENQILEDPKLTVIMVSHHLTEDIRKKLNGVVTIS